VEFNSWPCLPLSLFLCPSLGFFFLHLLRERREASRGEDRERGIENKIGREYIIQARAGDRVSSEREKIMEEAVAIKLWVQNVREGN